MAIMGTGVSSSVSTLSFEGKENYLLICTKVCSLATTQNWPPGQSTFNQAFYLKKKERNIK